MTNQWSGMPPSSTLVIGHRGFSQVYPENTVLAYDKAIVAGAKGIEIDVRRSRDGGLIVIHDPTLDRTTAGTGKVRDYSTDELTTMDAGGWKSAEFDNLNTTKLTTLDCVLDRYKGEKIFISIQFKDSIHDIRKAIATINAKNMKDQCFLFANRAWIGQIKKEYPDYFIMNDGFHPNAEALLDQAIDENWNAISPGIDHITPALVARAHEQGILVQASVIHSNVYERSIDLLNMNVNFLLGDDCDEIVKAVQDKSLRQIEPAR